MRKNILYFSLLCWFLCVQAHAATITVKDATDSASPTAVGHTLRSAIAAAVNGDVIRFDASLNGTPMVINPSLGKISVLKDISIIGNGPQNTILDGNSASSIIIVGASWPIITQHAHIEGITFQNGINTGNGVVGTLAVVGTMTIKNCKFINNQTGLVAINYNTSPFSTLVEDSEFIQNNEIGAYIENMVGSSIHVNRCLFDGNQNKGLLLGDKALITNSRFQNNTNNTNVIGAALMAQSEATIVNSIFTNNHTNSTGAAIAGNVLKIYNSTIANNYSSNPGAGIFPIQSVTLTNCIVAKNQIYSGTPTTGNDIYAGQGTVTLMGGNVIGNGANLSSNNLNDFLGTATNPIDPLFVDLPNHDVNLLPCSPAINVIGSVVPTEAGIGYDVNQDGLIVGNLNRDYNNNNRLISSSIDAGALEYQGIVNGSPVATFSYQGNFCQGSGIVLPNTLNPGGTYSVVSGNAAGLAINTSTGAIDLNNSATGTYTIQYSVTDCNGGQVTHQTTITIYPPLTAQVYQIIGFNGVVSSIYAAVQGGSGNYSYSWVLEGVVKSTSSSVSNPCSYKTYVLTVTDQTTGCTTTINYSFNNRLNRCKETTDPVLVRGRTTDIEVTGKDAVYPNPNSGTFTISSAKGGIVRYEVYNMQGQVVVSQQMNAQRVAKVALQAKKGVYLLRAYTEANHVIQEKIVIK
jgi:hypothetical protein